MNTKWVKLTDSISMVVYSHILYTQTHRNTHTYTYTHHTNTNTHTHTHTPHSFALSHLHTRTHACTHTHTHTHTQTHTLLLSSDYLSSVERRPSLPGCVPSRRRSDSPHNGGGFYVNVWTDSEETEGTKGGEGEDHRAAERGGAGGG